MKTKQALVALLVVLGTMSCHKKDELKKEDTPPAQVSDCPTCSFPDSVWNASGNGPRLIFRFKLDSTQVRLNNLAQPVAVGQGNAAQSPTFNAISAHYIEMATNDLTPVGDGAVLYKAEETTCGGDKAIVFCKSVLSKNGDVFFSIPLAQVPAGSYKWLRVSLAYQNYDVYVKTNSTGTIKGTIASFVGFNTYVTQYRMKNAVMTPTLGGGAGNKLQGYWGFYANVFNTPVKVEGQAPQTTVVNPNPQSPIPAGSCLVTGAFYSNSSAVVQPLIISGNETQDVVIEVCLSTNKSFEWRELNVDGLFQPDVGETVVDMGLRGMIPKY